MTITSRLICRNARDAIGYYQNVFGATVAQEFAAEDGTVIHAILTIGDARIAVSEASGAHNQSPHQLNGSSVVFEIECDDPDTVFNNAVSLGAESVFEMDDRFYGNRDGRFCDPYGHLWLVYKKL